MDLAELQGPAEARGAEVAGTRVHSVRLPSFVVTTEIVFGGPGERLILRHDPGLTPDPYVAGTLGRMLAPVTPMRRRPLAGRPGYVLGGRGATTGTPTAAILAVDVARRRLRLAGRLAEPLRGDLAARSVSAIGFLVARRPRERRHGRGHQHASSVVVKAPARSAVARMPALLDRANVYAADAANQLPRGARFALSRLYVPNSKSDTVDVIDPRTFHIVGHFSVGGLPRNTSFRRTT